MEYLFLYFRIKIAFFYQHSHMWWDPFLERYPESTLLRQEVRTWQSQWAVEHALSIMESFSITATSQLWLRYMHRSAFEPCIGQPDPRHNKDAKDGWPLATRSLPPSAVACSRFIVCFLFPHTLQNIFSSFLSTFTFKESTKQLVLFPVQFFVQNSKGLEKTPGKNTAPQYIGTLLISAHEKIMILNLHFIQKTWWEFFLMTKLIAFLFFCVTI